MAPKLSKKVGNRLSVHGISLTEFLIMCYLDGALHKVVPKIELVDHMAMSPSGITRLVAPMVKNRIVEKVTNPRNARQSLVKLSKTGQRLYDEIRVTFEHTADELLNNINQGQVSKTVEVYAKLLQVALIITKNGRVEYSDEVCQFVRASTT